MSANLIEKLKKSRETNVKVDGKTFIIIRPTAMQIMNWLNDINGNPLSKDDIKQIYMEMFSLKNQLWRKLAQQAIELFVVGWSGVKEIDIIPGGADIELPFNRELFLLWVQDYPAIVTELGFNILDAWSNHLQRVDTELGKPEPG